MIENNILKKWFRFELDKLREGIVTERKFLIDLLNEEDPSAPTRKGIHKFDKKILAKFATLPSDIKMNLKMPIFLYFDHNVEDSCYLTDKYGADALKYLHAITGILNFRNGKLWLSKPLALDLTLKYKTAIQIIIV